MFKVSAVVGNQLSHRLSYEDAKGRIPKGMIIRHSCDNTLCVNPSHLIRGSQKQNVADMDARGRRVPPKVFGEKNYLSKLTNEQVIEIRQAYIAGDTIYEIGPRYGIKPNSVSDLTTGRAWKHLLGVNGAPTLADLKARAAIGTNSSAKVTKEIAAKIRQRLSTGELGKDLAVEYGLHKATISQIKLRKSWND